MEGAGRIKLKAREREGEKGERFRLTLRLTPLLLLLLPPHLSNGSRGRVFFFFFFPSPLLFFFFFSNDSPKFKLCLLKISAGRVRKPESASHRQHPGELDNSRDCPAGTQSLRFGVAAVCLPDSAGK